ncbi:MAG TPA: tRNA (adenosine(37)-N6)-threonylcarbamoyltransferase complex dimerization subunit type 1 TsaB [Jatrophihabitantaceae bacterium]
MLVLVLDTSSAAVAAALVDVSADGVSGIAEHVTVDARGHAEYLAPMIDACLRDASATPGDLHAVVAGTGPGPFTGLRVGLVTAAVLSETLDIPAYGVCSLDGIADGTDGLLVATDARRNEVYWASYRDGARVDGPQVSRPAEVPLDGLSAMAGAGARLYQDVLRLPLLDRDHPVPIALAEHAQDRIVKRAPSEPLTPLYLRRPDAVAPGAPKAVSQ